MVENKRIWFRECWNFSRLKWNKNWPAESFFALRFVVCAWAVIAPVDKVPIWGRPRLFTVFCVRFASPQLWNCPLLWAACLPGPVTVCIVQQNQLFILLLLRLFLNICIFGFVFQIGKLQRWQSNSGPSAFHRKQALHHWLSFRVFWCTGSSVVSKLFRKWGLTTVFS